MRCVESALGLGGHVVIGVVRLVARFHHADAIPNVEFFPSGLVRLYSVIVNFICSQIIAHFYIAKTGHLRCCLYNFRIFRSFQFVHVSVLFFFLTQLSFSSVVFPCFRFVFCVKMIFFFSDAPKNGNHLGKVLL